jgi:hypothetical protein
MRICSSICCRIFLKFCLKYDYWGHFHFDLCIGPIIDFNDFFPAMALLTHERAGCLSRVHPNCVWTPVKSHLFKPIIFEDML